MNWEEILQRDGPAAWAVAYRILGNRTDADDCYQEAMLNAVKLARKESVHNWAALLKRLASARAGCHWFYQCRCAFDSEKPFMGRH